MFRGLLIILSLVVFLVNAKDYQFGKRHPNDHLLVRMFAKKSALFLWVVERDVLYNPYHFKSLDKANATIVRAEPRRWVAKISHIKIVDKVANNKGAYVELQGGGVGHRYARIHFESQRSHEIDSVVEIYGH